MPLEPVSLDLLGSTSTVFDAAFATALPFVEVYAVQISGAAAALSGATVQVEFDSRVSAVAADDVVVAWGKHLSRREVTATMAGRASLVLPDLGEDAQVEAVVGLPLGKRPLYPHENVGTPTATSVAITTANGSNLASAGATTTTDTVAGPVWGAELATLWQTIDAKTRDRDRAYSVPAFVRVASVGPAPIPVGTRIFVTVDSSIVSLAVDDIYLDDSLTSAAHAGRGNLSLPGAGLTTVTVQEAVPAGQALTIALRSTHAAAVVDPERVTFARAWLAGPDPKSALQRVTGAETSVAVTDSGTPLVESAFVGQN